MGSNFRSSECIFVVLNIMQARRALRALKGLVKLQALVRGHILRRKTAETMRCMQAMLRAQARARSVRAYIPESPYSSTSKSCPILHPVSIHIYNFLSVQIRIFRKVLCCFFCEMSKKYLSLMIIYQGYLKQIRRIYIYLTL